MSNVTLIGADMAEGNPLESEIWDGIDLPILAAGGHAGSKELFHQMVDMAKREGKPFAIHPGYPDRENFGRLPMDWCDADTGRVMQSLDDQITMGAEAGAVALKPHGAYYHQTMEEGAAANHLVSALAVTSLAFIGYPGSAHEKIADRAGVEFWPEGFLDRRIGPDGRLLPRSHPDALVTDPEEAWDLYTALSPRCRVLCVHSDTPRVNQLVNLIRERRR